MNFCLKKKDINYRYKKKSYFMSIFLKGNLIFLYSIMFCFTSIVYSTTNSNSNERETYEHVISNSGILNKDELDYFRSYISDEDYDDAVIYEDLMDKVDYSFILSTMKSSLNVDDTRLKDLSEKIQKVLKNKNDTRRDYKKVIQPCFDNEIEAEQKQNYEESNNNTFKSKIYGMISKAGILSKAEDNYLRNYIIKEEYDDDNDIYEDLINGIDDSVILDAMRSFLGIDDAKLKDLSEKIQKVLKNKMILGGTTKKYRDYKKV